MSGLVGWMCKMVGMGGWTQDGRMQDTAPATVVGASGMQHKMWRTVWHSTARDIVKKGRSVRLNLGCSHGVVWIMPNQTASPRRCQAESELPADGWPAARRRSRLAVVEQRPAPSLMSRSRVPHPARTGRLLGCGWASGPRRPHGAPFASLVESGDVRTHRPPHASGTHAQGAGRGAAWDAGRGTPAPPFPRRPRLPARGWCRLDDAAVTPSSGRRTSKRTRRSRQGSPGVHGFPCR